MARTQRRKRDTPWWWLLGLLVFARWRVPGVDLPPGAQPGPKRRGGRFGGAGASGKVK